MDYLKKMMIEHSNKSLAEWLEATPHLDSNEVTRVFNEVRTELPSMSIKQIEDAHKW